MSNLKFIKTKQEIQIQAPTAGLEFEYPAPFIIEKKKPDLIIPRAYETKNAVREAFINSLRTSKPDINAGKQFVYMMLETLKEENITKWESYGITIAEAGTSRCLGSVLVIFCSIYRMGSILEQGYREQVSNRIITQAVGIPDNIPNPDALIALAGEWLSDVNYLKMIAGIDMFLHRFPKSLFAKARVGTIASRYRDCALLLSVRFFLQVIGSETVEHAPAWISYEPVAADMVRLCHGGPEASIGSSYFPYQADLGIVRKSAYSTIVNPSYLFFVHGVGALLGLERSRNARMTLEHGISGTVANVFWVAYVHKRNHVQALQFTVDGQPILTEGESEDTENDRITIRSNDPIKWARFLGTRDWVLTEFMKNTIRRMQQELVEADTRPGTIGDFLAKHSID